MTDLIPPHLQALLEEITVRINNAEMLVQQDMARIDYDADMRKSQLWMDFRTEISPLMEAREKLLKAAADSVVNLTIPTVVIPKGTR
jgi:hypothetical protein